jgi:uncharacterized iron-regulated membrane protein
VGLVMAIFLLIAGLTGAILAWYHELDAAMNPQWMRVQPRSPNAQPLDPFSLHKQAQAYYPEARIDYIVLRNRPGEAIAYRLEPSGDSGTRQRADLANDEIFLDPYTGSVLGERKWGAITQGWHNLLPFIYKLHYALALDQLGVFLMGIVAVLWTVDCFVGAYLTFPASLRKKRYSSADPIRKHWWRRWKPAWKVRWKGNRYKVNFDLHRAGGLWTWAMLFVLAWSSVSFNMQEVYHPVMRTLFTMQPDAWQTIPQLPAPQAEPGMDWPAALVAGRRLMADLAQTKGFSIRREENLSYIPSMGVFRYQVLSDLDIGDKYGGTNVFFDSSTGRQVGAYVPTGEAAGDTVTNWLAVLHIAAIWGIPFKIFITVMGIAVSMLSITGVYIWWKKSRSRQLNRRRRIPAAASSRIHD